MDCLEDTDAWDIERDLHFLIATDVQLETELDHVCELLLDSSDELAHVNSLDMNTTPAPTEIPAARKRISRKPRRDHKLEMLELQRQVKNLKEQLESTQHQVEMR
ncbi:unnamed protein product [Aphanomyces euteiches]